LILRCVIICIFVVDKDKENIKKNIKTVKTVKIENKEINEIKYENIYEKIMKLKKENE